MVALGDIIEALIDTLDGLTGVDLVSSDSYLPVLKTADTALIIPPWEVRSVYGDSMTLMDATSPQWQSHMIRVEFWIRQDDFAAAAARVRQIEYDAIAALYASGMLGGEVEALAWTEDGESFDTTIHTRTEDVVFGPDQARSLPFLRLLMDVPVYAGGS